MSTQIHQETEETLRHAHALITLDHTGHTALVWDDVETSDPEVLKQAREVVRQAEVKFHEHLAKGGTAIETDKNGNNAKAVKDFNKEAERTVLIPRMVGG